MVLPQVDEESVGDTKKTPAGAGGTVSRGLESWWGIAGGVMSPALGFILFLLGLGGRRFNLCG